MTSFFFIAIFRFAAIPGVIETQLLAQPLHCTHASRTRNSSDISQYLFTRLLRPESTSLLRVLQIVSDDVGLLEEQAHGVGQLRVLAHLRILQPGGREELRQPHANQPCHIVAILQRGRHKATLLFYQILDAAGLQLDADLPGPTPSWIPLSFQGTQPFPPPSGGRCLR